MESKQITLNNQVTIELVEQEGQFLGLGGVSIDGFALRDGSRPMFVEIRDPNGIQLTDFRITSIRQDDDSTVVTLNCRRIQQGQMEWMLHTVRNRYAATDWTEGPVPAEDTVLELVLKPVHRAFRDDHYEGFSYQYRYRSSTIPIYRILDRGTWEPGGQIVGSEFWLRNGVVPSVQGFETLDQRYSTEWYLPDIQQPSIFQFFPFQAQLQGFTFTAAKTGNLVTWATRVEHIRSLFEKHAGKNVLFHWHEHCGDLTHHFETSPMEVLWHPVQSSTSASQWNRFEHVREFVWQHLHDELGLRAEVIEPYGVIEEWTLPDLVAYREEALPALLDVGAKTIFIPNQFENNMNVWGLSNMCCNVDFKVAESVGEDNLRSLCKAARNRGAKVEMWGNTAISTLTYIFDMRYESGERINFLPTEGSISEVLRKAKNPYVRNASGAVEADHYTPVFCALNLRDPDIWDYWMKCWSDLHSRIGVDQIFVDSSFNMSADKFTHRQNDEPARHSGATLDQANLLGRTRPIVEPPQAIESQYKAYLQLMVEMQQAGYTICGEDTGVFGLSRSGPDVAMRQPAMPMWLDSYCTFDPKQLIELGQSPEDVFFEGLAYRVMWQIFYHLPSKQLSFNLGGVREDYDRPTEWHSALLRAYSAALPTMRHRTIHEDHAAVEYEREGERVIWVFADQTLDFGTPRRVVDLIDGTEHTLMHLEAKKNKVYRVA